MRIHSERAAMVVATLGIIAATGAGMIRLPIQPESRLWIEGGSTVRDWTCRATQLAGGVQAEGPLALSDLQTSVRGADLAVPVKALECGNGTMNDHLRKALQAGQHPEVRFQLTGHQVTEASRAEGALKIDGRLTIAGQEKAVTMDATARPEGAGTLRVRGSEEIVMSEYGVKPPSLMMGTMKVKDRVVVHFDVLLRQ